MAQTKFYQIINGDVSEKYPYEKQAKNQKELEAYREALRKKHNYKTGDYDIRFGLKLKQSEIGRFHT